MFLELFNFFLRKLKTFDFFNEAIKITLFQEGKICVIINFLPDTKVAFGNIIYADFIFQFSGIILVTSHTNRDDISVTCVM